MKIGIINNGAYKGEISGGDVHIARLAKALSKNNDVVFILPEQADKLIEEVKSDKIKLVKIKEPYEIKKKEDLIKPYFFRAKKTKEFLKKNKFDLIIAANPFFCDILPLLKLEKSTRVICWIFHVLPNREVINLKDKIINILVKIQEAFCFEIIKRKADLIFTCNEIEKQKIIKKMKIKNSKVAIGKLGVDASYADKLRVKRKKNTALFVGRLVKAKGIYELVKIMEVIAEKNKNFKLYIVGAGPEEQELKKKIKEKGLENNMIILGYMDNKQVLKKMKEAEYFFFPSYEEGFGIVIAESLYCGNKVICYRLKHYKEFFGDYPEYVVAGDIDSFAEKLGEKKDLEKQKEFAKKLDYKTRIKEDVKIIDRLFR